MTVDSSWAAGNLDKSRNKRWPRGSLEERRDWAANENIDVVIKTPSFDL